ASARDVDRGVHDLRVRKLGPLGRRQVDQRDVRQRLRARLVALAEKTLGDLLLRHLVELLVVVEQSHQCQGASSGPGPAMTRNQKLKMITAMPALTTNTRSRTPSTCRWPAARRTSRQAWSSRLTSTSVRNSVNSIPANATVIATSMLFVAPI